MVKKKPRDTAFSCYVYSDDGTPIAWCHTPKAAAAILSELGTDNWVVKWRSYVLWTEGDEEVSAMYMTICAKTIEERFNAAKEAVAAKKLKRQQ